MVLCRSGFQLRAMGLETEDRHDARNPTALQIGISLNYKYNNKKMTSTRGSPFLNKRTESNLERIDSPTLSLCNIVNAKRYLSVIFSYKIPFLIKLKVGATADSARITRLKRYWEAESNRQHGDFQFNQPRTKEKSDNSRPDPIQVD